MQRCRRTHCGEDISDTINVNGITIVLILGEAARADSIYAKANPEKVAALIENKDKRYQTDYVFYSILYAAGIEAEGDNKQVNIFR